MLSNASEGCSDACARVSKGCDPSKQEIINNADKVNELAGFVGVTCSDALPGSYQGNPMYYVASGNCYYYTETGGDCATADTEEGGQRFCPCISA